MTVTCAWCGAPATTEVEVAPSETKSVDGVKKLTKRAHHWPACPAHATFQRTPPRSPQQRKPGPKQITVFDVLSDTEAA